MAKCSKYTEAGYNSGWRLPSNSELESIWTNKNELRAFRGFEFFATQFYWSHTEYDDKYSYGVFFYGETSTYTLKSSNVHYARCIRDLQE